MKLLLDDRSPPTATIFLRATENKRKLELATPQSEIFCATSASRR